MQVSVKEDSVNAPVPNGCPTVSVVVAVSPAIVALVPHAKPRTVAFPPPVLSMVPLSVADVCPTDEADCVLTVGLHGDVVNDAEIPPRPVPPPLVAYALE